MRKVIAGLVFSAFLAGCGGDKTDEPVTPDSTAGKLVKDPKKAPVTAAPQQKGLALLVSGNEFGIDDEGSYTVPDVAVVNILKPVGERWVMERIEEKDSNIFHKAIAFDGGILTIGANQAILKHWTKEDEKWSAKILWKTSFGGKQNRLRDFEMADFDGDGKEDLAIATHDQGVVAVLWNRGEKWEAEELDRKPSTFVHEIEVGDLDKDGKLEIYATPSEPNTVSAEKQGGKVTRYAWTGKKFEKSEVVSLETRHIKEILVEDVDGDGTDELYAALEAETKGMDILKPVEIRRYDAKKGAFKDTLVTTINDRYCRFLLSGDLDKDGKQELIATAFSTGVWLIEKNEKGYVSKCIDSNSGGFEHSAYIADIDLDGTEELYVADDTHGKIKVYEHSAGSYLPSVIFHREVPGQAMVWNITTGEI